MRVEQGFTQKQIAKELGVCERTVRNDWKKLRTYVKGQINATRAKLEHQRILEFNRQMAGMTLTQQFRFLKKPVREVVKWKQRMDKLLDKIRRQNTITINLDDCIEGIPSILPNYSDTHIDLKKGLKIEFIVKKDGVKHDIGGFKIRTTRS